MKLSNETVTLLKNYSSINPSVLFKTGNVVSTISPQRSIFAKALVKEEFPQQFGIAELNKFLGVLSMFKDPELRFFDNYLEVFSGMQKVRYTYADPSVILTPPEKELTFPAPEVEFDVSAEEMSAVVKALSVLALPQIAFVGNGKDLELQAIDSKNPSADVFSTKLGNTDKTFKAIVKTENIKLLPKNYHISVSSKGIIKFEAQDITYFVASEANSSFG